MIKNNKLEGKIFNKFGEKLKKEVLNTLKPSINNINLLIETMKLIDELDKINYIRQNEEYYNKYDKLVREYKEKYNISMNIAYNNINILKKFYNKNGI